MPAVPTVPPGGDELVFESDWLASRPFFYNLKNGRASSNVNDVIDLADAEFDPEGFNDFLDFGFAVFERTPLRDVRTLRYSSRLVRGPGGLRVEYLDDPARELLDRQSTVAEVLELASAAVNRAAADGDAQIVVPTSGGLDSRLIDVLLTDRRRVRAFTYGTSDDPRRSFEAVKARELAQRLGMRWDLIPLGEFHRYLDEWDDIFGISMQAHGMYQIEFYRAICARVAPGSLVLSGACGEWFAGDDRHLRVMGEIRGLDDILKAFRYGRLGPMRAKVCSGARTWAPSAWSKRTLACAPRPSPGCSRSCACGWRCCRTFSLCRPRSACALGRRFSTSQLAMGMLTLPAEQRLDRRWLREFFTRRGVDLETRPLPADGRNTLNYQGMRRVPLGRSTWRCSARSSNRAMCAGSTAPSARSACPMKRSGGSAGRPGFGASATRCARRAPSTGAWTPTAPTSPSSRSSRCCGAASAPVARQAASRRYSRRRWARGSLPARRVPARPAAHRARRASWRSPRPRRRHARCRPPRR